MTITPLSPSPITGSVRRRYLIGTGHAPPTATVSASFHRQNADRPAQHHVSVRSRATDSTVAVLARPPSQSEIEK
jgi:hypothetical protein